MLKKITTLFFLGIMILTIVPNEVFASNHGDEPFQFYIEASNNRGTTKGRAKKNTTSTYVNIEQLPSAYINLQVQGFRPTSGSGTNVWKNETIGGRQTAGRGQWLVRQLVYENGGRSARLRFDRHGGTGTVKGKWSPDSVGTYPRLN
ncbi:hypothetical protein KQI76_07475 [Amphibacillus sp. MSJ-3]|uniref:hypothetical protein n=1 Tax=Amphibacillus sp. MSJ-3 TaxID=2841505 RepID=UPI001C0EB5B7|nr:hypothetical protein [Amphibacillus sp. MSJ-3]MBU5595003.1 hypothetical protein [Amphibacillus sp. MSJ-3]